MLSRGSPTRPTLDSTTIARHLLQPPALRRRRRASSVHVSDVGHPIHAAPEKASSFQFLWREIGKFFTFWRCQRNARGERPATGRIGTAPVATRRRQWRPMHVTAGAVPAAGRTTARRRRGTHRLRPACGPGAEEKKSRSEGSGSSREQGVRRGCAPRGRTPGPRLQAAPDRNTFSRCSGGSGLVSRLTTIITVEATTTQVPATPNGFFHS